MAATSPASRPTLARPTPTRTPTALCVYGVASPLPFGSDLALTVEAKCLDGSSAAGMRVLVLDELDTVVASAVLEATPEGARARAVVNAPAPAQPGLYTWHVLLRPDESRAAASRPVYFSVASPADRQVSVTARDSKSGKPIAGAAAFFYNDSTPQVKPLRATSDEQGVARTSIASGAPYRVRVVASNYVEADADLPAGDAETPAEAQVELLPGGYAMARIFG